MSGWSVVDTAERTVSSDARRCPPGPLVGSQPRSKHNAASITRGQPTRDRPNELRLPISNLDADLTGS